MILITNSTKISSSCVYRIFSEFINQGLGLYLVVSFIEHIVIYMDTYPHRNIFSKSNHWTQAQSFILVFFFFGLGEIFSSNLLLIINGYFLL